MSVDIIRVSDEYAVSAQISAADIEAIVASGAKSLLCSRPDGEANDQPTFAELEAVAREAGLEVAHVPVISGKVNEKNVDDFLAVVERLEKPIHAYCRTGTRSMTLWTLYQRRLGVPDEELLTRASACGYDLSEVLAAKQKTRAAAGPGHRRDHYDIVIVGAGAAGIAVASSLMARTQDLAIAIIDPAAVHYYQPGWTMVGAGVFTQQETVKTTASLIPRGVTWIQAAVGDLEPDENRVLLEDARPVYYDRLIVAPGIKLDWNGIEGLVDTLGDNGVTSNYRFDLAPYTWELVSQLRSGRAVFTQPPMPIKCAGAPQKAVYMSADHWKRSGSLGAIDIAFYNAGQVLFGVKEYVPALMAYMEGYGVDLNFGKRLVRIDGPGQTAWFETQNADGGIIEESTAFDMIHVVPPQTAPDFVRGSPLADEAGWIDVDQNTLQHRRYANVWGLGDAMNAPNAKTAAAARMQAPIVANNLLQDLGKARGVAHYNGYGSCPLTVERGKIVLAEFGYGGKLLPSFPRWLINGEKPSRLAWILKEKILPPVYWKAMLRGREWMVEPERSKPGANAA
ncbi:bifunctional protein tyrosine phosphatase family protein/NAD(P)/FAD-dependent oxidoreductase [Pseudohaliea rubra]|uniref:Oxidoreductase (Flavoprotein) n=1 Tax=Pseudohaliea rubra DSM 19751 TaxID=1265313 RepID=A0A095VPZ6_9GAMM|nr:bifunctional protein tyrosine phosphatase family protein/NAD(P)/FAD-dependent oxidoreductase [Pseudohaliea rubra]KGE03532.1 Oxidoreductase (flavoprotein) [Pseudohaliea rubra DSM 19751]